MAQSAARSQLMALLVNYTAPDNDWRYDPILLAAKAALTHEMERSEQQSVKELAAQPQRAAACQSDVTTPGRAAAPRAAAAAPLSVYSPVAPTERTMLTAAGEICCAAAGGAKRALGQDQALMACNPNPKALRLCSGSPQRLPPRPVPLAEYYEPMLESHSALMAVASSDLVGRYVQVHRPDLGLMTPWAVARVTAYDDDTALHTLSYAYENMVQRVCFAVMASNSVRLIVKDPKPAFVKHLRDRQRKPGQ